MSSTPAMKDTTGFLVPLDVMNSAACSSAVPPISPIMMMPSVCDADHPRGLARLQHVPIGRQPAGSAVKGSLAA